MFINDNEIKIRTQFTETRPKEFLVSYERDTMHLKRVIEQKV